MSPHLPPDVVPPELPRAVHPLVVELGEAVGHRLVLLSIEDWGPWADLRFGRVATKGAVPLVRRIPLASDWEVRIDGQVVEVLDVAGRGDRAFSNGEVRIRPAPAPGSRLSVHVMLSPGVAVTAELVVPTT